MVLNPGSSSPARRSAHPARIYHGGLVCVEAIKIVFVPYLRKRQNQHIMRMHKEHGSTSGGSNALPLNGTEQWRES